jgi:ligand-binding sensor domain-containing protein
MRMCPLLLGMLFITSCGAAVKTSRSPMHTTAISAARKMMKTQGSTEYANVHCALMDKDGSLWFGTTGEGVYRYDGERFTQFTTKEGLRSNTVWSILEDASGSIWFGTDDGICRYDGNAITSIPIPATYNHYGVAASDEATSTKNAVWSILQDRSGTLWIGTSEGVHRYNGTSFTPFLDDASIANPGGLHLKMVACMLEDTKGNIWFGSGMPPGGEGLCRYDGESLTSVKPNGQGWIRALVEHEDGSLYLATRHRGVCRYDGTHCANLTAQAGIHDSSVTSIIKDKAGHLWIATELGSGELGEDGGVWRYDGRDFARFTTTEGLVHNGVYSMVEDRSGNVWFGTRNIGLCRFDGKTFTKMSE